LHEETTLTFTPLIYREKWYFKNSHWYSFSDAYWPPPVTGFTIPDLFTEAKAAVIPIDAQRLALERACRDILPDVTDIFGKFNLYTFVLELSEVANAASLATGLLKKASVDNAIDSYIGHQFGYLPMISDFAKIYEIFSKFDDAIDLWNEHAKKGIEHTEHRTVYSVSEDTAKGYKFTILGGKKPYYGWHDFSATVVSTSKVHLTFRPKIINKDLRSKYWLKAFGLDKPLSGVWEAVPFSWAIDYFTNIGDMIEAFERSFNDLFAYEYVTGGYSVKDVISYNRVSTALTDRYHVSYVRNDPCYNVGYTSRYERIPLPDSSFRDAFIKRDSFRIDYDISTQQASYLVGVGRILTRK
jgi:hypothetical protein